MSDLENKQTGIRFEPVLKDDGKPGGDRPPRASTNEWPDSSPGIGNLVLGSILPAGVIAVEAIWKLCAENFFDPMPTLWHALAIAFVPAMNLGLWLNLRRMAPPSIAAPVPVGAMLSGMSGSNTMPPTSPTTMTAPTTTSVSTTTRTMQWLVFGHGAAVAIAMFYALIFAPLLPIAVLALVYFGMGVLPMGPLASLIGAARLRHLVNKRHGGPLLRRTFLGGMATGLGLLLVLDIPAAATRMGVQLAATGDAVQRQRGVTLLRTFGDHDLLLRLCYDTVGRPAGLLSALVMFGGGTFDNPRRQHVDATPAAVREIYYRVRGEPFNARPAPHDKGRWQRFGDFAFDADHGGSVVGGRIKGLDIVASRLDGSISGDDAVAYLEWTVEFRNVSAVDREARLQLALPPGGVVSRATLWVDGEEREAAYGGKAEVRAAYQRVAVQQRRDPLLVTTKGADRVLAQAFPVPRNGGTIKFKVGLTAPLDVMSPDKARLVLPAIVDRNFSFAPDLTHSIWIEGKRPLSTATAGLAAQQFGIDRYRVSGQVSDASLARVRPVLLTERGGQTGPVVAQVGEGQRVVQEIALVRPTPPSAMLLVVDGSARMKPHLTHVIAALEAVPSGAKVGLLVAGDTIGRVAPAPMTSAHRLAMVTLLRETDFVGGQNNNPALIEAMRTLEAETAGRLLWVHAPQPIVFTGSGGALEHVAARLARLPEVVLYAVEPGPNEVLPDLTWSWPARTLARTSSTRADLAGEFARAYSDAPHPVIQRRAVEGDGPATKGSEHIARLWTHGQVLEMMRTNAAANRSAALALAVNHRLVTPISGAVVLETQQQYDESRLSPVAQATVPTVPEPHEWALLAMVLASFVWLSRRRSAERVTA